MFIFDVVFISLKMGKTIYCLSNGSPIEFPDNTLTNFSNKLPFFYDFHKLQNHKIHMCLEAIGFSTNFVRKFLPTRSIYPSIVVMVTNTEEIKLGRKDFLRPTSKIVTFKKDNTRQENKVFLDTFIAPIFDGKEASVYRYVYLDDNDLTREKLLTFLLDLKEMETIEIEELTESNKVFVRTTHSTVIYIHTSLLKYIEVNQIPMGQKSTSFNNSTIKNERFIKIGDDKYRRFKFSFDTGMLEFNLNIFHTPILPKIIKVRCDNIRDQIFGDQKSKDLMVFCPEIARSHKFFYHEFESKIYCVLENTLLNTVKFYLVDEYDEQLDLEIGIPTILKLDLIAMEKYKKSFNVRVTSEPQKNHERNTNNQFKTTLPQTLYLNENWRVALSSINLPNVFNTFLTDKQTIGYLYGTETNKFKIEYKLHNRSFTKEELLAEINFFFKNNARNIDIGEISEQKTEDFETKAVLKINSGAIVFTRELAEVLGYVGVDYKLDKRYFVSLSNDNGDITTYVMQKPVDVDLFKPSYFMLYSKLVQPTAVSGNFMNILKIFPVAQNEQKYVIQEFKHREYLQLNNSDIKEIEFELRSHSGDLIQFCSKTTDTVILNLHFTNYI
jgi:hypothetical protein